MLWTRFARLLIVAGPMLALGCNRNPFLAQQMPLPPNGQPQLAQLDEYRRRIDELDANNRDLHAQLAQTRQQIQFGSERIAAMQKQLGEAANQLEQARLAKQESEKKVEGLLASTQRRGGATLTANNSVRQSLQVINLPGFDVRQEEDVIRIEVPADQLFAPGTAQFNTTAAAILDQVAGAIATNYPKQMVGIEGHTDSSPPNPQVSAQQLSGLQALAVYEQVTRRSRIANRQLFTVAHGANHPRVSNASPQGRAKNRRIEFVIYADSVEP